MKFSLILWNWKNGEYFKELNKIINLIKFHIDIFLSNQNSSSWVLPEIKLQDLIDFE